jgi:hypothetical protein
MHFTTTPRIVTFTVDDDEYSTKAALPAEVLFKLQGAFAGIAEKDSTGAEREKAFDRLKKMYARILSTDSYALFEPRLTGDYDDDSIVPIDAMMLVDITKQLIAEMGKGSSPKPDS